MNHDDPTKCSLGRLPICLARINSIIDGVARTCQSGLVADVGLSRHLEGCGRFASLRTSGAAATSNNCAMANDARSSFEVMRAAAGLPEPRPGWRPARRGLKCEIARRLTSGRAPKKPSELKSVRLNDKRLIRGP